MQKEDPVPAEITVFMVESRYWKPHPTGEWEGWKQRLEDRFGANANQFALCATIEEAVEFARNAKAGRANILVADPVRMSIHVLAQALEPTGCRFGFANMTE